MALSPNIQPAISQLGLMDEMKFTYSIDSLDLYTHTLKYIRAIDASSFVEM